MIKVLIEGGISSKANYQSDKFYLFLETYKAVPDLALKNMLVAGLTYINQQLSLRDETDPNMG
jgi:hypothetical protein